MVRTIGHVVSLDGELVVNVDERTVQEALLYSQPFALTAPLYLSVRSSRHVQGIPSRRHLDR